MNERLIAAAMLCAALAMSCSQPVTDEQRANMLESERAQIIADLHRHRAECQAQAIEFANVAGGEKIVASCLDGHRAMVDASRTSIANIDAALLKLGRPAGNPFDQFDAK